ncbi:MAG: N-acetyltransferase [Pseudomonadota bacterium]
MTPAQLAKLHGAVFDWPRPWSEAEFASLLSQKGVILATSGLHSFAMGRIAAEEFEIFTIATHPNARRAGHARSCLNELEDKARFLGALDAFLEVAANNEPALGFYKALDYRRVGTRPRYYGLPNGARLDAQILSKSM